MELNVGLIIISFGVLTNAMEEISSTYIKKADNEDLKSSGSGYSYQLRSGEPAIYSSYNTDSSGKLDLPPTTHGRYSYHPIPLRELPLEPEYSPYYDKEPRDSYGRVLVPYAKGYDNFLDGNKDHYGYSTNFIKGGGSNYEDSEKSLKGERGESGYSNRDEFENGIKGQHGKTLTKGYYGIRGGKKLVSGDASGHYGHRHQGAKAHRGGSFSNAKGHDKGSKTTGYHKVFHKDELTKDHSFYDKSDKRGHFNRYGDFDAKKSANEGAFKKGGSHDSGFEAGKYGQKGISDKGHFINEDSGYKGAKGNDKFYKVYEDFAKKGGSEKGSESGYSEGQKHDDLVRK